MMPADPTLAPMHEGVELLPCPFCGEPPEFDPHFAGDHEPCCYIGCNRCDMCLSDTYRPAAQVGLAIAAWNRRATLSTPPVAAAEGPITAEMVREANDAWRMNADEEDDPAALVAAHLNARLSPTPDAIKWVGDMLEADPACNGRVCSGTIEAIAARISGNAFEPLTYPYPGHANDPLWGKSGAGAHAVLATPDADAGAMREALERIADVSERWPDNLASQINEIARVALAAS